MNDYDEEALIDYIGRLENPFKVGFKDGIWRPPTDSSKWDINQIGMGLDTREEHNPIVYNFLKSKGRLKNPYLTEQEEHDLRMLTWKTKKPILDKFISDKDLSLRGIFTAAGMLWHGHPYKMMNTPDSVTGKALEKALSSGDKDLKTVFDAYYLYPENKTRYLSRYDANNNYWHGLAIYNKIKSTNYQVPWQVIPAVSIPSYKPVIKQLPQWYTNARALSALRSQGDWYQFKRDNSWNNYYIPKFYE